MPGKSRKKYTAEEEKRYSGAYHRLESIIGSEAPDAEEFRSALDKELAAGFPIDFYGPGGWTLLHETAFYIAEIRAGLSQVLIDAGADVNARTADGDTPLGSACSNYVWGGEPEYLTIISTLLAAGARSELDEGWKRLGWTKPSQQARRDRLEAYIAAWDKRRAAASRAGDAAPAFDYAL